MDSGWLNISVHGNIPWIGALIVVNWPLENTIVIVIPVELIEHPIIIMIKWMGSETSVKHLDEIVDSIVIVV